MAVPGPRTGEPVGPGPGPRAVLRVDLPERLERRGDGPGPPHHRRRGPGGAPGAPGVAPTTAVSSGAVAQPSTPAGVAPGVGRPGRLPGADGDRQRRGPRPPSTSGPGPATTRAGPSGPAAARGEGRRAVALGCRAPGDARRWGALLSALVVGALALALAGAAALRWKKRSGTT